MFMKSNNIYIVYFEWANTKGNHAGMSYLASKLASDYECVRLIKMISGKSRYKKALNLLYIFIIAIYLKFVSKKGDKVFLMEYLARSCFQDKLAHFLRLLFVNVKIIGLVHLAGSHLMEIYHNKNVIRSKMSFLDECVVFGTSLAKFLTEEICFTKVITTFHYVDTEYYKPIIKQNEVSNVRILCLGNIKRDFSTLREIVDYFPNLHFDICQGVMDLSSTFGTCQNVQLYGFIKEDELLNLMQKNDVCLSIMTDTIGSNVITTSLATGLILVVSDVGSIRDYCDQTCSFLCNNTEDYKRSIEYLLQNPIKVEALRQSAIAKSQLFSYNNFRLEFERIFNIGM